MFKIKNGSSCMAACHACSVYVCLHYSSWCSCSGGLRSWERHEAITQCCVPPALPDATIALRLGQPGCSTVLAQLFHFPKACSINVKRTELLQSSRGIPEELCLHAAQRHCRNSGGNTSDFLCYCSQHPTFLLKPPHHTHTHTHTEAHPFLLFCSLFLYPFFFPGCNQETIWEQRLPIRAGEWRSVV